MEPLDRAERGVVAHSASDRICSRMVSRICDGGVGSEAVDGDDAVVGAGGVDDQAGGAEHLVERAAGDVDVLDADERDQRVDVEQPAVDALQQSVGQAVAEAA